MYIAISLLLAVSTSGFRFNFHFIIGCRTAVKQIPIQRLRRIYLKANVEWHSNRNRVICIRWKINNLIQHLFSAFLLFSWWKNGYRRSFSPYSYTKTQTHTIASHQSAEKSLEWKIDLKKLFISYLLCCFRLVFIITIMITALMIQPRPTFRISVVSSFSPSTSIDNIMLFIDAFGILYCVRRAQFTVYTPFCTIIFVVIISIRISNQPAREILLRCIHFTTPFLLIN